MSDKHYVGLDLSSYEDNGTKYAISRVTLITADNEYFTAGDDTGLEITAECPYATQAMVDAILAQLKGYKFQGYSAESANLDPAAELGDGITASGIYSVIGKISDDGTGYVDVSAPGEAELDEEYPTIGPQTQEFQRNLQATRKQIEDNNRDLRLAIENATEYITGNEGGYVLIRLNDEKKPYEILIMDTDDINTAKNVWRWNKSGFGHSNSGYEGPYETAITQDGSIVATYITTGVLNAVLIQTGILKSKDGETFYLDLDKGILKLKATQLSISGQTVEEIAKSKADSALSSAKSYADSAASGAFNSLTQQQIFNKLTGGGSNQGIYLENGRVYINASYIGAGEISANIITSGKLTSKNGKVYFDLNNNEIACNKLVSADAGSQYPAATLDYGQGQYSGGGYRTFLRLYNDGYNASTEGIIFYVNTTTYNEISSTSGIRVTGGTNMWFYANDGSHVSGEDAIGIMGNSSRISVTKSGNISLSATGNKSLYLTSQNIMLTAAYLEFASNLYPLGIDGTGKIVQTSKSSARYKIINRTMGKNDVKNLYQITPVWAKYKNGYLSSKDERYGIDYPMLVAEDVEKYAPLAVDHDKEGRAEDWNYRVIIPYMFEMIKDLKQEIDELKKKMEG